MRRSIETIHTTAQIKSAFGDLRRFGVPQTPVKKHQMEPMWKKSQVIIMIIVDFAVLADHRIKLKEWEKNDKYLDLAWELKKKTMEHEGDNYTDCDWCFWHGN